MNASSIASRLAGASVALFFLAIFTAAEVALAGPIVADQVPIVAISIDGVPGEWEYAAPPDLYRPAADGGYELNESQHFDILDNRATVEIQELRFNPDPFVLNNLIVTNNAAVTQTFTATVILPTVFGAPNLISGTVLTSVIDGGGAAGATVATSAPLAIYRAQIDGATVATLQDDPFSVVAPAAGANSMGASFGPNGNLTAVTSDIGIALRFSLTPGDTAAILSRFDVNPIPEPSSVALCLLGIGAVWAAARKPRLR